MDMRLVKVKCVRMSPGTLSREEHVFYAVVNNLNQIHDYVENSKYWVFKSLEIFDLEDLRNYKISTSSSAG